MPDTPAPSYEVLVGLNYPPSRRAEVGDIVSDIPVQSVHSLLADGHIRPAPTPKGS